MTDPVVQCREISNFYLCLMVAIKQQGSEEKNVSILVKFYDCSMKNILIKRESFDETLVADKFLGIKFKIYQC